MLIKKPIRLCEEGGSFLRIRTSISKKTTTYNCELRRYGYIHTLLLKIQFHIIILLYIFRCSLLYVYN